MSVSSCAVLVADDVFSDGLSDHLPQAFDVVHEIFPTGIALFSWNVMGRGISWSKRQAKAAESASWDAISAPVTNNGLDLDEEIHEYEERIVRRVAPVVGKWIAGRQSPHAWFVCLQEAPAHPGILADLLAAVASAAGLARDSLRHAELRETASTSTMTLWDWRMWDMRLRAGIDKLSLCTVLAERERDRAIVRVLNCHLPLPAPKGRDVAVTKGQGPPRPPQEVVRELLVSAPSGQLVFVVGDLNFDVRKAGTSLGVQGLHVIGGCVPDSTIYQGTLLTSDALLVALGQAEGGESLKASRELHRGCLDGLDRESYIQQNIHHNLQARVRSLAALSDADLELLGAHHFSDQPVKLQEWLRSSSSSSSSSSRIVNAKVGKTQAAPAITGSMFGKDGRQAYLVKSVHRRLQARAGKLGDRELWLLGQTHFKDQFSEIDRLVQAAAKIADSESNRDATLRLMGLPLCSLPPASGSVKVGASQMEVRDVDASWEAPPPCANELEWSESVDRRFDDSTQLRAEIAAAAGGGEPCCEKVDGLTAWLRDLSLSEYVHAAHVWCEDMGAITLEEVRENADDLSEFLELKPLERRRLLRAAELPPT